MAMNKHKGKMQLEKHRLVLNLLKLDEKQSIYNVWVSVIAWIALPPKSVC